MKPYRGARRWHQPFLRLLRRLGAGRRTAKVMYRGAGWMSHIKTPHRMYSWDGTFSGWRWTPCNPSTYLMVLSMQLDWDHWDHWACVHEDCEEGAPCECGGITCPHDDDLDDEVPV